MRQADLLKSEFARNLPDALLLQGKPIGVNQNHGERAVAAIAKIAKGPLQVAFIKWLNDLPVGIDAPVDFTNRIEQRRGPLDVQGEDIRSGLGTDLQRIAKTAVGQQGRSLALAL